MKVNIDFRSACSQPLQGIKISEHVRKGHKTLNPAKAIVILGYAGNMGAALVQVIDDLINAVFRYRKANPHYRL